MKPKWSSLCKLNSNVPNKSFNLNGFGEVWFMVWNYLNIRCFDIIVQHWLYTLPVWSFQWRSECYMALIWQLKTSSPSCLTTVQYVAQVPTHHEHISRCTQMQSCKCNHKHMSRCSGKNTFLDPNSTEYNYVSVSSVKKINKYKKKHITALFVPGCGTVVILLWLVSLPLTELWPNNSAQHTKAERHKASCTSRLILMKNNYKAESLAKFLSCCWETSVSADDHMLASRPPVHCA